MSVGGARNPPNLTRAAYISSAMCLPIIFFLEQDTKPSFICMGMRNYSGFKNVKSLPSPSTRSLGLYFFLKSCDQIVKVRLMDQVRIREARIRSTVLRPLMTGSGRWKPIATNEDAVGFPSLRAMTLLALSTICTIA